MTLIDREAYDRIVEALVGARKIHTVLPLERRIERALKTCWRRQERAVLVELRALAERFPTPAEASLMEALQPDDLERIQGAVTTSAALAVTIETSAARALELGAAHVLDDIAIGGAFDPDWPEAVGFTRDHGAAHVTRIDDITRRRVRTVLTHALDEGWSYAETARTIKATFTGFSGPSPLAHIRNRAELVAVTEIGEAYEYGGRVVAGRLVAQGLVLEKRWITTGDGKVCTICAPNDDAGWISIDEPFPSGDDTPLAHPGCRCATERRLRPDIEET